MSTVSLALVDQYWGKFLGCASELIRNTPAPYLLTTATQPGLWAFTCGGNWVVATPTDSGDICREQIGACFPPNRLPSCAQLQPLLHMGVVSQLYGPALIFLHHPPTHPPVIDPAVRPLTGSDQDNVAAFVAAAGALPWTLEEATGWLTILGLFQEQALVATCGVRLWGDLLAEIYVDTHPAYRRRGFGKAVTTAALHWIHTTTPYYAESVVELSNQPSLGLMQSLGFEPYGYLVTSA